MQIEKSAILLFVVFEKFHKSAQTDEIEIHEVFTPPPEEKLVLPDLVLEEKKEAPVKK